MAIKITMQLSRNVIGFPSIADHGVAKCMLLLLQAYTRFPAGVSARGLLCMWIPYSISSHHITSHLSFSLCVAWARRGFLLRAAACDVHRRACVCMHGCGRVRGCSAFRFGPFTHGDGLGDGGVGNPPPRGKHMELNESCFLWKYLLRDGRVGWREGGKYVCRSTCSGVRIFGWQVAQDSGFRMLLARDATHLPRDMPPSEQREKAGSKVCMQYQYTVRVAV